MLSAAVVRDRNIVEPAFAALVQQRLGICPAYQPGAVPTITFDVLDGGVGFLDAITVADAFLTAGDAHWALIFGGEAHPSTETDVPGFRYSSTAAAMLLAAAPEGGFGILHTAVRPGPLAPHVFVDLLAAGADGRRSVTVLERPCPADIAAEAVLACLDAEALDLADIDILCSTPAPDFGAQLLGRMNRKPAGFHTVATEFGDPNSAAPVFAWAAAEAAAPRGRIRLFVAADGPKAACLSYRPTREG
ncbi:hypothetical protein ACWEVD_28595 [Nocardia thailandica]